MIDNEKYSKANSLIARNLRNYGDDCLLGFSGGKDSLVVLHLIRNLKPDIKIMYSDTGVEFPETRKYVKELTTAWELNIETSRPPGLNFWDCAKKWGFPDGSKKGAKGNRSDKCCYHLKEKPFMLFIRSSGIKCVFSGITESESRQRHLLAKQKGDCYFHKTWNVQRVHPIMNWTPEDVWDYIKHFDLPYNPLYDMGLDRVGCMACTAHKNWRSQMASFNPKLFSKIILEKEKQYSLNLT